MKLIDKELINLKDGISHTLISFRDGRIDEEKLLANSQKLFEIAEFHKRRLTNDFNSKRFPKSNDSNLNVKSIGVSEKLRAAALLNQPVSLIFNELQQEISNSNFDFVFSLLQMMENSNHTRVEKSKLNPLRDKAMLESGAGETLSELKKAETLSENAEALLSNLGKSPADYFDAVIKQQGINDLGYAMRNSKPGYVPSPMK